MNAQLGNRPLEVRRDEARRPARKEEQRIRIFAGRLVERPQHEPHCASMIPVAIASRVAVGKGCQTPISFESVGIPSVRPLSISVGPGAMRPPSNR